MIKNNIFILIIICCSFLGNLTCFAKEESASAPAAGAKKPKTVKVRFDDELVKGSTAKPDVSSMDVNKSFNYKKLIRVRENFLNEMEDGLDDFKGK